jgi:Mg-chelatase subunit ChlI
LKSKEIVFRLDDLYNKISNGNGTIGKMLQLSGRLDMMNVQLHSNRKDSFEDIEEEEEEESETSESDDEDSNDEEKEFDIYEEEEEDDEDEDEDKEDEDEDEEKENKKNEIVDDVFGVTDFSFLKEIK